MFTGVATVGKTTMATACQHFLGGKIVHIADGLKEELGEIAAKHYKALCFSSLSPEEKEDFRDCLVQYSRVVKKLCGDNVWIEQALSQVRGYKENIFFGDVRYIDEVKAIREVFPHAVLVYLTRMDKKLPYKGEEEESLPPLAAIADFTLRMQSLLEIPKEEARKEIRLYVAETFRTQRR